MPGHHGGPSISGSKPKPSKPSKPSSPSGYFGSMYTTPNPSNVDTSASGTSEEADKNIDTILGQGYSGGQGSGQGSGGGSNNDSNNQDNNQVTETKVEEEKENVVDILNNKITFGKPIKDLKPNDLKLILEQVKLYQEGMPNYFQGIPGAANFVKGIVNSMGQGLERSGEFGGVEGSPTLEGLEDYIRRMDPDSNMLDSFKEADPAAYLDSFGLPQTEAGLNFFANLSLDDDTVDKLTQQKIIEARERLAQSKESQDLASGIMSTPAFAIAPGQDAPPKPGPKPDAPSEPSFTPQNTSPFDLSQFYAGLPSYSYGQQGVMSPNINPSLASYYENLKKYYGVG